jgi:hypothetical protein
MVRYSHLAIDDEFQMMHARRKMYRGSKYFRVILTRKSLSSVGPFNVLEGIYCKSHQRYWRVTLLSFCNRTRQADGVGYKGQY